MRTDISIGIFDLFIFLGVFQGIFISWFFIKNSKGENRTNLYQGLLLLFLSLTIFEELLNNTGYIVQLLSITNFAEPFNFTFAPLFYLYVRESLYPEEKKRVWWHFAIAIFWLFYMYFTFVQPSEVKYNSYIGSKHPDWGYLHAVTVIDDDPLGVRKFINPLTMLQFVVYLVVSIRLLIKKSGNLKQSFFKTTNKILIVLRKFTIHFIIIFLIYLGTKLYYGMRSDVGDYLIASYISFMMFATSYQIVNKSSFFNQPNSFLNFPNLKYKKSSLSADRKKEILEKIKGAMEKEKYYTNNLASLSNLSKQLNETSHHVSQVINELLKMNFFELLASYRIDEAKVILSKDTDRKITIEELAEMVGYNSKSAFNNAFKKLCQQTPSQFREKS